MNMRRATARISHVMQAVKHSDQIEAAFADFFSFGRCEPHSMRESVSRGVRVRLLNRGHVKVISDKRAVRKRLCHQKGREADAATNICDLGAGFQLWDHAVERR